MTVSPAASRISTAAASIAAWQRCPRLFDDTLDRRDRCGEVPLREPQQGEAGCRLSSLSARVAIGALGGCVLAAEPVQVTELVQRRAERRVVGVGEVPVGVLRGGHGVVPLAAGLEDL